LFKVDGADETVTLRRPQIFYMHFAFAIERVWGGIVGGFTMRQKLLSRLHLVHTTGSAVRLVHRQSRGRCMSHVRTTVEACTFGTKPFGKQVFTVRLYSGIKLGANSDCLHTRSSVDQRPFVRGGSEECYLISGEEELNTKVASSQHLFFWSDCGDVVPTLRSYVVFVLPAFGFI
jgi:hypothetical protein